jgi:hypothetical protein
MNGDADFDGVDGYGVNVGQVTLVENRDDAARRRSTSQRKAYNIRKRERPRIWAFRQARPLDT